jgi:hypothetical protein
VTSTSQLIPAADSRLKWPAECLNVRISAVQEAIKRARFGFFISILAAAASFACLWNAHLSWYRGFGFSGMPAIAGTVSALNPIDQTRAVLRQNALRVWVESQVVSVNLVGIRIAVSDFALLNSLAMYMFAYYLLLCYRRENREVGQLLRDIRNELNQLGYTVYASISAYMVFNLNRTDDNPVNSLETSSDTPPKKIWTIRWVVRAMAFAPFIVVVFTIVCDLGSLFVTSPLFFSSPYRTGASIWPDLSVAERTYVIVMELAATGFAIFIYRLIQNGRAYQIATRDVLDSFHDKLRRAAVIEAEVSES